jgi:hypothetical protein
MANVEFGLRSIGTNAQFYRYEDVGGVPTKVSIGYALKPSGITLNPGVTTADVKTKDCYGATVTALTYIEEQQPTVEVTFPAASADVIGLIFGNSFEAQSNVPIVVPFEISATTTTFAARPVTEVGYYVGASNSAANARAWTIDPATALTKELVIGSDVTIDDHMSFTISQALVDAKAEIRGWVQTNATTAGVMSSKAIGLVGMNLFGVDYAGRAVEFDAELCSLAFGATLAAGSDPQVTFRILPNPASVSKKGYDWKFIPKKVSC